jgi:hypothetical protein
MEFFPSSTFRHCELDGLSSRAEFRVVRFRSRRCHSLFFLLCRDHGYVQHHAFRNWSMNLITVNRIMTLRLRGRLWVNETGCVSGLVVHQREKSYMTTTKLMHRCRVTRQVLLLWTFRNCSRQRRREAHLELKY